MQPTMKKASPVVVTLLSPSIQASRSVRNSFFEWLGFDEAEEKTYPSSESLNQALGKTPFSAPLQWASITFGSNSTVIHLLAPAASTTSTGAVGLLSIQQAPSIDEARERLAHHLQETVLRPRILLQRILGNALTPFHLLGGDRQPIIQWTDDAVYPTTNETLAPGQLKEIVLPTMGDHEDSLHMKLSSLHRPVTGLYQLPGTELCVRPIPAAIEDKHMAPPALVFHVESIESLPSQANMLRIGYTGLKKGQMMARHPNLLGLDVRFCESTKRSSVFAEAHESLLAGSMPDLQSKEVLIGNQNEIDPKINNADCWIEFRTSLKNPMGFFRRPTLRTAQVPNIPPE